MPSHCLIFPTRNNDTFIFPESNVQHSIPSASFQWLDGCEHRIQCWNSNAHCLSLDLTFIWVVQIVGMEPASLYFCCWRSSKWILVGKKYWRYRKTDCCPCIECHWPFLHVIIAFAMSKVTISLGWPGRNHLLAGSCAAQDMGDGTFVMTESRDYKARERNSNWCSDELISSDMSVQLVSNGLFVPLSLFNWVPLINVCPINQCLWHSLLFFVCPTIIIIPILIIIMSRSILNTTAIHRNMTQNSQRHMGSAMIMDNRGYCGWCQSWDGDDVVRLLRKQN